jgi:hypothetical protein
MILIAFLLALSACATEQGLRTKLDGWVGAIDTVFLSSWGQPDLIRDREGYRELFYKKNRVVTLPGSPMVLESQVSGNNIRTVVRPELPEQSINLYCTVIFKVRDRFIAAYRFTGNDCTST